MLYQTRNPHGGDIYDGKIELDFSANTNPFGTPESVLDAARSALARAHEYPDPYCRELVQAIAQFESVPKHSILCGNGSAELIYSFCRAVRPASAVMPAPTFSEYAEGLAQTGCKIGRYALDPNNDFDLDEGFLDYLAEFRPEAVFLCNPNNPTGRVIGLSFLEEILDFCGANGARLFVDECFLDLTDDGVSMKDLLADNSHLFILKGFTKSYGMAGLRLGYCLSSDRKLLTAMSQNGQPWNVSTPAQAAGIAALRESGFLRRTKELIRSERARLTESLEALGFRALRSSANYILFRGEPGLDAALLARGIAIRNCENYCGLGPGWYRIAVRLPEENGRLIAAMREICGE